MFPSLYISGPARPWKAQSSFDASPRTLDSVSSEGIDSLYVILFLFLSQFIHFSYVIILFLCSSTQKQFVFPPSTKVANTALQSSPITLQRNSQPHIPHHGGTPAAASVTPHSTPIPKHPGRISTARVRSGDSSVPSSPAGSR